MLNQILPQNPTARNGQPTAKQTEFSRQMTAALARGDDQTAAAHLAELFLALQPRTRRRLAEIVTIFTHTDAE
jgi:hypothetical protein